MLTAMGLGVSLARMEPITVDLRTKETAKQRPLEHMEPSKQDTEKFLASFYLNCFDNRKQI